MKKLETTITINASAQKVWNVLMNHEDYPNWNPFITDLNGSLSEGQIINVRLQPPNKKPMEFSPVVIKNEKAREFRWLGHLFVKGLFDGEHFFILKEISKDMTQLVHGENFSGFMAGAILRMIGANTEKGFAAMNEALKQKVEGQNPIS